MRAVILEDGVVENAVLADPDYASERGWVLSESAQIGDVWDGEKFVSPPAPPVELGQMDADKYTIAADTQDTAVVSITSPGTVHFVVDDELYSVEPENDIATLEITANAPGPIRVEMQNQSLMIVAQEVTP